MEYNKWLVVVESEVIARVGTFSPVMVTGRELWALFVSGMSPRHAAHRVATVWDAELAA